MDAIREFFNLVHEGKIERASELTNSKSLVVNGETYRSANGNSLNTPLWAFEASQFEFFEILSSEIAGEHAAISAHFVRGAESKQIEAFRISLLLDKGRWIVLGWDRLSLKARPSLRFFVEFERKEIPILLKPCTRCG